MGTLEVRILKKARCVHYIGNGVISYESLIQKIKAVRAHSDFDLSFNFFFDFENAVLSFDDEGFMSYNLFFQELQSSKIYRKWAIYTMKEMTFKTANMHHLLASDVIEVKVFQNREMALAFLGITEEDLAVY